MQSIQDSPKYYVESNHITPYSMRQMKNASERRLGTLARPTRSTAIPATLCQTLLRRRQMPPGPDRINRAAQDGNSLPGVHYCRTGWCCIRNDRVVVYREAAIKQVNEPAAAQ
jgi:hypothetical protein